MSMYRTREWNLHTQATIRALHPQHLHQHSIANLLEQLQNAQDDVVHIAKARAASLLGVVETTRPVDRNIAQPEIQAAHRIYPTVQP